MVKYDIDEVTVKSAALLPLVIIVLPGIRKHRIQAPAAVSGSGSFNLVNGDSTIRTEKP